MNENEIGVTEDHIEQIAMRLANRAYLYRIFHIVFGAEPSAAEIDVLGSSMTSACLRDLADDPAATGTIAITVNDVYHEDTISSVIIEAAEKCEELGSLVSGTPSTDNASGFLSADNGGDAAVSDDETTSPVEDAVSATGYAATDGIVDAADTVDRNDAETTADKSADYPSVEPVVASFAETPAELDAVIGAMKSAYNKLFSVPGKGYVYPWESPYIGRQTMLFQESTLEVRRRYAAFGYESEAKGHFPEDHIAMMLDFMAHLANDAYEVFVDGEDDGVVRILDAQEDFIGAHFDTWLARFQEELAKKDTEGTYYLFAAALRGFLIFDGSRCRQIKQELSTSGAVNGNYAANASGNETGL